MQTISLEEQVARMRADVASLRAEVAQLRQAQTRTVSPPAPPTIAAVPPLPLAPGVAPPSLANRLPIPSMPIGSNHFGQAPVTPTRPRPNAEAMAAYPTPSSVHRNNHPAAAAGLSGNSDCPTSPTGGGVPLAAPVANSPTTPGYYFLQRGVHPPNPYATQPMPATSAGYGVQPSNNNHAIPLDCPLQAVAAPPSSWYATPTRPSLTYPISHERPAASVMPVAQANPGPLLPLMASFSTGAAAPDPPSFAVPMSIPPTVSSATLPPATLPWLPVHVSGLYEQQNLPTQAAPQYHVVTGGRSISAPSPTATVEGRAVLHPTSASAPGVLWSVPRASGPGQPSGTNGVGSGGLHQHQQQQRHQPNLVLGENLGNDASANELVMLSGGGSSRRPSLQQPVTDWQALIDGDGDDLAPTQQPTQGTASHPPTSAVTFGGGGAGGSSGADVEATLASMMMP